MRFDELNEDNYLLFAIKFYNNPHALTKDDFEDDLKRIKYVKRLLKRYKNTGVLKTCLLYTSPSPRDLSTSRMPSSA